MKKQDRALLKRLKKNYKTSHKAWEALNFYDFWANELIVKRLNFTREQLDHVQEVMNMLSQICKIQQEEIIKLKKL